MNERRFLNALAVSLDMKELYVGYYGPSYAGEMKGFPRFLLYDPEGRLYMLDAPRPSSSSVGELLDSLK